MFRHSFLFCALFVVASAALAQPSAGGIPAPRALAKPISTSEHIFGDVSAVHVLRDGRLIVNDTRSHRVVLLDSALRSPAVLIDSNAASGEVYGARPATLFWYLGDSLVFVESVTPSARIIDPLGRIVRTMALTQPRSATQLASMRLGGPGVDARGRFIHSGSAVRPKDPPLKPGEKAPFTWPDSTAVVLDNPETRHGDTLVWTRSDKFSGVRMMTAEAHTVSFLREALLQIVDTWTVLPNGTIAVLRGLDYHLDLIGSDGKLRALPKIPYRWEPMSDDSKAVFIDSVKRDRAKQEEIDRASGGASSVVSGAGGGGGGGMAASGSAGRPPVPPEVTALSISDLPDYRPAFEGGALRADVNGNLWIRTLQPVAGNASSIYDVVNSEGKLIDRVLISNDRRIVGFDKRGHIFLAGRNDAESWIETVALR